VDDIEPVFDRLERNLPLRDRTRGGTRRDTAASASATLTAAPEPRVRVDRSNPDRPVIDLTEPADELAAAAVAVAAAEPADVAASSTPAAVADQPARVDREHPLPEVEGRDATTPGRPGRLGRLAAAGAAVVIAARLLRRRR
jgi:hypothetical protein